jgi:hypothetical protein
VEGKQQIVIGTQTFGGMLTGDCVVEHSARGYAIDVSSFDAQADDASREHVHHDHNPVAPQEDGFAAKQIDAPKDGAADRSEPGDFVEAETPDY